LGGHCDGSGSQRVTFDGDDEVGEVAVADDPSELLFGERVSDELCVGRGDLVVDGGG
jgi:hypothetical protein